MTMVVLEGSTAPVSEVEHSCCLDGYESGYTRLLIGGLARKKRWSFDRAQKAFVDAIRVGMLCVRNPGLTIVPSEEVDDALDYVILDSVAMRWLERHVFGARINHRPMHKIDAVEMARKEISYQVTMLLMKEAWGDLDEELWPPHIHAGPCGADKDGGCCIEVDWPEE